MIDQKDIPALKKRWDELNTQAAQAKGRVQALREQLKDEFGVETPKQAKAKLVKLAEEIAELDSTIAKELEAFEHDFPAIVQTED